MLTSCELHTRSVVPETISRAGRNNHNPQILLDSMTCPCPWYLLLARYSSCEVTTYNSIQSSYEHARWTMSLEIYNTTHDSHLFGSNTLYLSYLCPNYARYIESWLQNMIRHISVTSWWARWRLKSPASRLFTQPLFSRRIKNIKAVRHRPLWGEFNGGRWIPCTKG